MSTYVPKATIEIDLINEKLTIAETSPAAKHPRRLEMPSNTDRLLEAALSLQTRSDKQLRQGGSESAKLKRAFGAIRDVLSRQSPVYIDLITDELRISTGGWNWKDSQGKWHRLNGWEQVLKNYPGKDIEWLFEMHIKEIAKLRPKS